MLYSDSKNFRKSNLLVSSTLCFLAYFPQETGLTPVIVLFIYLYAITPTLITFERVGQFQPNLTERQSFSKILNSYKFNESRGWAHILFYYLFFFSPTTEGKAAE